MRVVPSSPSQMSAALLRRHVPRCRSRQFADDVERAVREPRVVEVLEPARARPASNGSIHSRCSRAASPQKPSGSSIERRYSSRTRPSPRPTAAPANSAGGAKHALLAAEVLDPASSVGRSAIGPPASRCSSCPDVRLRARVARRILPRVRVRDHRVGYTERPRSHTRGPYPSTEDPVAASPAAKYDMLLRSACGTSAACSSPTPAASIPRCSRSRRTRRARRRRASPCSRSRTRTPTSEVEAARATAAELGLRLLEVETHELTDPRFRANPPDRCYYCKRELFGLLRTVADARGLAHVADGSNADDLARPPARPRAPRASSASSARCRTPA